VLLAENLRLPAQKRVPLNIDTKNRVSYLGSPLSSGGDNVSIAFYYRSVGFLSYPLCTFTTESAAVVDSWQLESPRGVRSIQTATLPQDSSSVSFSEIGTAVDDTSKSGI
jgi:hypothetical protein